MANSMGEVMSKDIGINTNRSDVAITDDLSLNETTATDILAALEDDNKIWIEVNLINFTDVIVWVRKYASSVDDLKKGVAVFPGETYPVSKRGQIYTGVLSAIYEEAKQEGKVYLEYV